MMLGAKKSDRIAPAHAASFFLCVSARGIALVRMDSEEFRDPERSQPFSTSTGAVEQQPQRGPDNDSEWEAIIEKDRRSVTSFEQAFK